MSRREFAACLVMLFSEQPTAPTKALRPSHMPRGWLRTPPPERGRSTAQRSGGGRDPHPTPPLFQPREEIPPRSERRQIALRLRAISHTVRPAPRPCPF